MSTDETSVCQASEVRLGDLIFGGKKVLACYSWESPPGIYFNLQRVAFYLEDSEGTTDLPSDALVLVEKTKP